MRARAFALFALATCLVARADGPVSPPDEAHPLAAPGWAPENRARLERFLLERGVHGASYDPARPPVAVFDWDNTSIFNDVGEASFAYQLDHLRLALTPAQLAKVLPAALVKTGASLAAERQETLEAFGRLCEAGLVGPREGRLTWAQKQAALARDAALGRAHAVLRYRLQWFYEALDEVDGALVAYPFLPRLFTGFTPLEVERFMEDVLRAQLRHPERGERCGKVQVRHPDDGHAPITTCDGLVLTPEVMELMSALRSSGIDVYVVSASFRPLVCAIASRYGIAPDRVVGIRTRQQPDGTYTEEVITPITYRQGKVENVGLFVPRDPILAAGDADTDVEMLTMPSVELRLIVHRNKHGDIGALYERARTDPEHTLTQGRNDYGPDGTAAGTWNGKVTTDAPPP